MSTYIYIYIYISLFLHPLNEPCIKLMKKLTRCLVKENIIRNYKWWGMDFVSRKGPAVSNSLTWGHNFFVYGHRCGDCHNASDAQVRNKRMQYAKIKQCKWFFLTGYLSSLVCHFLLPPGGCTGEALYVVLGASRCDWHLFLWVMLSTL